MEAAEILAQSVDKSKMPPLHQKRILAFVNHFLVNSCDFLNKFAGTCELKFIELERKMQRVEAALMILETKLANIPDTELNIESPDLMNGKNEIDKQTSSNKITEQERADVQTAEVAVADTSETSASTTAILACNDMRYKKFFKMIQFGVPAEAVKLKMQAEGLQPNILDTPNLVLADSTESGTS